MDGEGQSGTSMIEVHGEGKCVYGDLEIDKNDVNRFQVVVLNLDDEPEESEEKTIRLLNVLLSDTDTSESGSDFCRMNLD